jgi:type IV pilus assembly protein PilA
MRPINFRGRSKHRRHDEDGFTLIELLVVIIIIGILAAIAIPVFLNQRQKGYDAQAKSDVRNMATAEETYLTDNPTGYTASIPALSAEGFKESANTNTPAAIAHTDKYYCLSETSQSGKVWYLTTLSTAASGVSTTACS